LYGPPPYEPYFDNQYSNGDMFMGAREPKPFTNQSIHPRLFVGSLPPDTKEEEIKEMFTKYGSIVEFYLNAQKNFAFIRMESRDAAHKAQMELDGKTFHNRQIRVKRAPHAASIWVGKLPAIVSNELLADAFSTFGEIERAIVACDERGKAKGWGLVEFKRKGSAANAVKKCTEGHLLLTTSFQPVKVEPWAFVDDEVGVDHKSLLGYPGADQQLSLPPRIARPGELEHVFADKWKKLFEDETKQKADLQKHLAERRAALEKEQERAVVESHIKRRRDWEDKEREMRERAEREAHLRRAAPPPYAEFGPPAGMPIYENPEIRRLDGRYDRDALLKPDPYYQAAWDAKDLGPVGPSPLGPDRGAAYRAYDALPPYGAEAPPRGLRERGGAPFASPPPRGGPFASPPPRGAPFASPPPRDAGPFASPPPRGYGGLLERDPMRDPLRLRGPSAAAAAYSRPGYP
jgi:hypothetical protein